MHIWIVFGEWRRKPKWKCGRRKFYTCTSLDLEKRSVFTLYRLLATRQIQDILRAAPTYTNLFVWEPFVNPTWTPVERRVILRINPAFAYLRPWYTFSKLQRGAHRPLQTQPAEKTTRSVSFSFPWLHVLGISCRIGVSTTIAEPVSSSGSCNTLCRSPRRTVLALGPKDPPRFSQYYAEYPPLPPRTTEKDPRDFTQYL